MYEGPNDLNTAARSQECLFLRFYQAGSSTPVCKAPTDALAHSADARIRKRSVIFEQVEGVSVALFKVERNPVSVDMIRAFESAHPETCEQRSAMLSAGLVSWVGHSESLQLPLLTPLVISALFL